MVYWSVPDSMWVILGTVGIQQSTAPLQHSSVKQMSGSNNDMLVISTPFHHHRVYVIDPKSISDQCAM